MLPKDLTLYLGEELWNADELLDQLRSLTTEECRRGGDLAMRGSRGAAPSIVMIHVTERRVDFCGVGNVDGRILHERKTEHLVPRNGIVGFAMPCLRPTRTTWPVNRTLVMHSDRLSARCRLEAHERLAGAHPALVAGPLFRDCGHPKDDATVLVLMRWR